MTNAEKIMLSRARLSYLNGQMALAVSTGDSARIEYLQAEIAETEALIDSLSASA